MPSTRRLCCTRLGHKGKRSANAALITYGRLQLDDFRNRRPLGARSAGTALTIRHVDAHAWVFSSELAHRAGFAPVASQVKQESKDEKGVCHGIGVPRKSIERRTLSGRRLHQRPQVHPRIRSARLEDGITFIDIVGTGASPAPHQMNSNATALGGVTFPWNRAKDGNKRSAASLASNSASTTQEEEAAHRCRARDLRNGSTHPTCL